MIYAKVRPAQPEDHDALVKLAKQSPYISAFSSHMFSGPKAYENGWIRVAESWSGDLLGFTCVRQKIRPPETMLYFIMINPEFTRLGLGEFLMEDLERNSPHSEITLKVMKDNTSAIAMYSKLGYAVVEEAYEGKGLLMRKTREGFAPNPPESPSVEVVKEKKPKKLSTDAPPAYTNEQLLAVEDHGLIINIRGTSGSGKSTAIHQLMSEAKSVEHFQPTVVPADHKRRMPWGYLLDLGLPRKVAVLGHYETKCGGCDTIDSYRLIFDLLQEAYVAGHHVIYEGLLISGDGKWAAEMNRIGLPLRTLWLDTPLETCIERVIARREERHAQKKNPGVLKEFNPANTEYKFEIIGKIVRNMEAEGAWIRRVSSENAATQIKELLNEVA